MVIVIGSGGHTTEILSIVKSLGSHYVPRYYIMANTDNMSEDKVKQVQSHSDTEFHIYKIPRSREVKQSWISTVVSTLHATLYSFPRVIQLQPEIILCNGPGTCIPICIAGLFLKCLLRPVKIIYIESICRVETLSLSGKILYHLADAMFVQWPQLQAKYPKTKYLGRIV